MAQQPSGLKATARARAGKGAARQTRREGNVPAVIYGDGKPPETIALDYVEMPVLLRSSLPWGPVRPVAMAGGVVAWKAL